MNEGMAEMRGKVGGLLWGMSGIQGHPQALITISGTPQGVFLTLQLFLQTAEVKLQPDLPCSFLGPAGEIDPSLR